MNKIEIPTRKIICKNCGLSVFSCDVEIFESDVVGRASYNCSCGTSNLIKIDSLASTTKEATTYVKPIDDFFSDVGQETLQQNPSQEKIEEVEDLDW